MTERAKVIAEALHDFHDGGEEWNGSDYLDRAAVWIDERWDEIMALSAPFEPRRWHDWELFLADEETVRDTADAIRNGRSIGLGDEAIARSVLRWLWSSSQETERVASLLKDALVDAIKQAMMAPRPQESEPRITGCIDDAKAFYMNLRTCQCGEDATYHRCPDDGPGAAQGFDPDWQRVRAYLERMQLGTADGRPWGSEHDALARPQEEAGQDVEFAIKCARCGENVSNLGVHEIPDPPFPPDYCEHT